MYHLKFCTVEKEAVQSLTFIYAQPTNIIDIKLPPASKFSEKLIV